MGKWIKGRRFSLPIVAFGCLVFACSSQAGATTLRVCNNTSQPALVASSYIPVGQSDWRNVGWTPVAPRSCRENLFTTDNNTVYLRAEVRGDSSQYWGTDIQQCVDYPGPYDFYTRSDETTCPQGMPEGFTTIDTQGKEGFTWNLDP